MARRQDTRAKPPKATSKSKPAKVDKVEAAPKSKAKKVTKPSAPAASKGASKALLDAVRTPISAATTTGKSKAKKVVKSARITARSLVADLPKPSVPDVPVPGLAAVPSHISDALKSVGSQIAGALNTDVGRVMVAELLIYVAKSLTQAASKTDAAEGAKSTLLNVGAKIGAAAADAGAKFVETGKSAVESGSDAAEASVKTAGEVAGSASGLVRDVAQVAVSAVGGVVAEVAQKALTKRARKPVAMKGDAASGSQDDKAPATASEAGHTPPVI